MQRTQCFDFRNSPFPSGATVCTHLCNPLMMREKNRKIIRLGTSELSLSFNLIEHARKRCVHTVARQGRGWGGEDAVLDLFLTCS